MSYTKRQFVAAAFGELGISDYEFDLSPEEIQYALTTLDAMMADWSGKGIKLGYPAVGSPENSELDAETNVPDKAIMAIRTNLAKQIAPSFGKMVSPDTKAAAREGLNTVMAAASSPPEMQLPSTMPRGAGQKTWRYRRNPFYPSPTNPKTDPSSPDFFNF